MGTGSGSAAPLRAVRWSLLLAVACAASCAGPGDGGAPSGAEGGGGGASDRRGVRGCLVLVCEAVMLKPCGEERELAVEPHPALAEAYAALSRGEGAPVFVEVVASRFVDDALDAEVLAARELRRAAPAEEGFGCDEDVSGFAFRAAGVEPFWSVRVAPDGLTYTTPELAPTLFEGAEPRRRGEGWVWEVSSTGPEALTLRLELHPGPCSDSMVGALYSWSATVDIGGAVHEGCAWEGAHAPVG